MIGLLRILLARDARRRPGGSFVVVASVAAGVFVASGITPTVRVVAAALSSAVDHVLGAAVLHVTPVDGTGSMAERVRAVPGVADVVPVLAAEAFIGPSARAVRLVGVPLSSPETQRSFASLAAGASRASWEWVSEKPGAIAVNRALARRLGLDLFTSTTLSVAGVQADAVVGALVDDDALPPGAGDVVVTRLDRACLAFRAGRRCVDRLEVGAADGQDVGDLEGRLRAAIGPAGTVTRPARRPSNVDGMVASIGLMVAFLEVLGLVAAGLVIFGIVTVRMTERRREVAAWRAVGATPAQTVAVLMIDTLALATLGAAVGAVAAAICADPILRAATALVGGVTLREVAIDGIRMSAASLAGCAAAGIVTAAAASGVAVWPAARRNLDLELRPADVTRPAWSREGVRVALALVIVAIGLLPLVTGRLLVGGGIAGAAASVCFVPATYLAVPALLRSALPMLLACFRGLGPVGRLAIRGLVRHRVSLALPVTVLALAIELGTSIGAVAASFEESLVKWASGLAARSLVVARGDSLLAYGDTGVDPAIVQALGDRPDVRRARVVRHRRIVVAGTEVLLRATGVTPPFTGEDRQRYRVVAGDVDAALAGLADGSGVFVSESLARRMAIDVSASIELATPTGPVVYRVLAIIVDYMAPGGTIVIGHQAYRARWGDDGVDAVFADMTVDADAVATATAIERDVAGPAGLTVMAPVDIVGDARRVLHRAVLPLYGLALVVFAVGMCGMVNALLASTLARTHEQVLLRAIGATPMQIGATALTEGLAATLAAGMLGGLAGVVGAFGWVRGTLPAATGWLVEYSVPIAPALTTVATAMLLAAVPLGLPAWHARAVSVGAGTVR